MKRVITCLLFILSFALSSIADAKFPEDISKAIYSTYPPAMHDRALESAYYPIDPSLMRGYVVLEKGGIPAERARYFISWQDYDYRGVLIDVGKDDKMKTRTGRPYTYLTRGDVMAVVGIEQYRRSVYLKLMSADVYIPEDRKLEKHHSRVTTMLGFKFPKPYLKGGDPAKVLEVMKSWLTPFSNVEDAKAYAAGMKDAIQRQVQVDAEVEREVQSKEDEIRELKQKLRQQQEHMDEIERKVKELDEGQ